MEPCPRPTSSVYPVSEFDNRYSAFESGHAFELEDLLKQITDQAQEHHISRGNDDLPESCGTITQAWAHHRSIQDNDVPESYEITTQELEQQLIMQNTELRARLDSAREHFARLYDVMKRAMGVSRRLYGIYLSVAHEKSIAQKKERASQEDF